MELVVDEHVAKVSHMTGKVADLDMGAVAVEVVHVETLIVDDVRGFTHLSHIGIL